MRYQKLARWALLLLGLVVVLGCSGEEQRIVVTGTVTFDGQPIDNGTVLFIPEGDSGSQTRPKFGTQIVNGKYAFEPNFGPVPGKYKVTITWDKKTGRKISTGDLIDTEETAQVLPPKYNSEEETVLQVTVSRRENKHDFALTSN
jgi:hypothetical protein